MIFSPDADWFYGEDVELTEEQLELQDAAKSRIVDMVGWAAELAGFGYTEAEINEIVFLDGGIHGRDF